jgi:hypothetical protein
MINTPCAPGSSPTPRSEDPPKHAPGPGLLPLDELEQVLTRVRDVLLELYPAKPKLLEAYHGTPQLIESDATGRAVARAWQEMLELHDGRWELIDREQFRARFRELLALNREARRASLTRVGRNPMYPAEQLRCSLGGNLSRPPIRCRCGRKRAADLYAEGWSLRQIGAEVGVPWTAVGHQLRRCRRRSASWRPTHPASTKRILELRDQDLTWSEVAEQVDMTVFGSGAATGRSGLRSPYGWAVGSRFSQTPLIRILRLAFGQPSLIISVESPPVGN